MKTVYKIGTRKSPLAQWQTDQVIEKFRQVYPEYTFEKVFIQTTGDRDQRTDLAKMRGQGVFVKAIQKSLLDGTIDFAVHSAKDMPSIEEKGLVIGAVPLCGNRHDSLLFKEGHSLPDNSIIGTSSLRRQFEIKSAMPNCTVKPLRGNIDTRLQKLVRGDYDAIIMAEAAIERLHIDLFSEGLQSLTLPQTLPFIPAVGQGFVAVECRDDDECYSLAQTINVSDYERCLASERAFLSVFGVGCNVPIGARAQLSGNKVSLTGIVGDVCTGNYVSKTIDGDDEIEIGRQLGYVLKEKSGI